MLPLLITVISPYHAGGVMKRSVAILIRGIDVRPMIEEQVQNVKIQTIRILGDGLDIRLNIRLSQSDDALLVSGDRLQRRPVNDAGSHASESRGRGGRVDGEIEARVTESVARVHVAPGVDEPLDETHVTAEKSAVEQRHVSRWTTPLERQQEAIYTGDDEIRVA